MINQYTAKNLLSKDKNSLYFLIFGKFFMTYSGNKNSHYPSLVFLFIPRAFQKFPKSSLESSPPKTSIS